jgi:hypothetical protein
VHGTGPHAFQGGLLLQLHQHDVRLLIDQPPDHLSVDPAHRTALWRPLRTACFPLRAGDLLNPAITDVEPQRQLLHRTLATSIRRQYLAPKIIPISTSHLTMLNKQSVPEKNQGVYPKVKWSSCGSGRIRLSMGEILEDYPSLARGIVERMAAFARAHQEQHV